MILLQTSNGYLFARQIKISLLIFFSIIIFFRSTGALCQDMKTYFTVQHPDRFTINWTDFYNQNNKKTSEVRKNFPHILDLKYGADIKQRLDLYFPINKETNLPIFLFLHGGGFREGDKAHYGSVAEPFISAGVITAVASYRLTGSGSHYPDQSNDLKSAIKWLHRNISSYGGDPHNIYVGGHSAGAILSADIGVNRSWLSDMGLPKNIVKGIVPISGPYDVRDRGRPGEIYTYAPTVELRTQASPILHIKDPVPKVLVAVGDQEKYVDSSVKFIEKLRAAKVDAQYLVLKDEDHADTALSLSDSQSELFRRVLAFIMESS